ncbi:MAG: DUF4271 domain-containing protein, partial [Bacteroidetes bacterium]
MHFLISENIRPLPYVPEWIILILLVQSGLLAYLYLYSKKMIFIPLLALIDNRIRREIKESRNAFQVKMLNLLDILFYLNFSFLIFYFVKYNNFSFFQNSPLKWNHLNSKIQDIVNYSLVMFFSILIIFIKKQSFVFLSHLFEDSVRYDIFAFNFNMFLKASGIFTFPVTFSISWNIIQNPNYIYLLFATLFILYIFVVIMSFFSVPNKT